MSHQDSDLDKIFEHLESHGVPNKDLNKSRSKRKPSKTKALPHSIAISELYTDREGDLHGLTEVEAIVF